MSNNSTDSVLSQVRERFESALKSSGINLDSLGIESRYNVDHLVSHYYKYSAAALAWTLCVSIFYETAYSSAIGFNCFSIMSAFDLSKTFFSWLGIGLVLVGLITGFALRKHNITASDEQHDADKRIVFRDDLKLLVDFAYNKAFYIISIITCVYIFGIILQFALILVFSEITTIILMLFVLIYIDDRFSRDFVIHTNVAFAVALLVTMIILASIEGQRAAIFDINRSQNPSKIVYLDNTQIDAVIYRLIEKGVLFKKYHGTTTLFIPWDNLKSIESVDMVSPGRPLIKSTLRNIRYTANYVLDKISTAIRFIYGATIKCLDSLYQILSNLFVYPKPSDNPPAGQ